MADRPRLLHDLDSHTQSSGKSIRIIAAQDEQFLKYDAKQTARTSSTATLNQILDSSTLVLDWLQLQGRQSSVNSKNSNEVCDKLKCEKFFANLEHLIRCLRHAVIEALLQERQEALRLLQIQFWNQYLQQHRGIEGWFAEWPNGQPPLNTTWPWNVKPSLVILWGVCWMFFDHNVDNSWMTPHREEQLRIPENLRTGLAQGPQRPRKSATRRPHSNGHQEDSFSDIFTVAEAYYQPDLNSESNTPWLHALPSGDRTDSHDAQSQDQARACYYTYQYIYPTSTLPSNPFPTQSTDNPSVWPDLDSWNPQYPNLYDNWQSLNPTITPQTREPQGKAEQPYFPSLQPLENSVPDVAACGRPGIQVMPAQTNAFSAQEPSPCLSISTLSPSAPTYPASASSIGSPNTNHKGKMEAVRKDDGLLHCAHADCVNEPQAFSRRCEYT